MSIEIVTKFYEAFSRRDAEGMVACYADDVHFSDPVFSDLRGGRAKNMWRMLCERGEDLEIEFSDVRSDGTTGSAHWEASYTFSLTGHRVHNVVDARFEISNGRISRHVDSFDLWRWSAMALGLKGRLLGWAPFVQNAIRRNGSVALDAWAAKRGA